MSEYLRGKFGQDRQVSGMIISKGNLLQSRIYKLYPKRFIFYAEIIKFVQFIILSHVSSVSIVTNHLVAETEGSISLILSLQLEKILTQLHQI